jgi:TRAP-type C4-dicarboxylate transport system substrate-binding protein
MVKDAVAKKYPGELVLNRVGGPESIPVKQQIEAVRTGVVDVNYTAIGYYVGMFPASRAILLTETNPWEERENGAYDLLNKLHQEKVNSYYLGRVVTGTFQFWSRKKVTKPDFTGLRIRSNPIYNPLTKFLGGTPLDIPQVDVYSAIQRNLIDAYWSASIGIRNWGWHEVTKYAIGPATYTLPSVILVNLDSWKKIPKHLQALLIEVTDQAERNEVARKEKQIRDERVALEKMGIEYVKWSKADQEYFLKNAYGLGWKVILKKDPVNGKKLEAWMRKSR